MRRSSLPTTGVCISPTAEPIPVRGDKTVSQLSGQYGVHGNQVSSWKRRLLEEAAALFEDGRKSSKKDEASELELYEQIGRLKMELEWLKKKAASFD